MTAEEMAAEIERLKAQLAVSESKVAALESEKAKGDASSPKEAVKEESPSVALSKGLFDAYVVKECSDKLTGEMDVEAAASLRGDVGLLWERMTGFAEMNNGRAYGLAVGRVQSGKTRNYIGLMFKAIENGFNTVVILTSKNKRLAYQTHQRVEALVNDQRFGLRNRNWLTVAEVDQSVSWRGGSFVPDGVNIAVVIKNESGHLAKLKDWIAKEAKVQAGLGRMRMLFIDDESDSATPNTNSSIESGIASRSDVLRLAEIVETRSEDAARLSVGKWLREFAGRRFDEATTCRMSKRLASAELSMRCFMELVRDDKEVSVALGLDKEISLPGNSLVEKLSESVYRVFNHDGRRRSPNWIDLHDALAFVFDIIPERSRINASICSIVGQSVETATLDFGRMFYVAYTATPFANMLNEDPKEDPLCPDFILPLAVGSRYFGLDRIFGGTLGASADSCRMNVVRTIPQEEYAGWVKPTQNCEIGDEGLTGDLVRSHDFADEGEVADVRNVEWNTLKEAVSWAFCTAAARRVLRKRDKDVSVSADDRSVETSRRWTTMLFNISHLSDQTNGVHVTQQALLETYLAKRMSPDQKDAFVDECMDLWRRETNRFTVRNFQDACLGYGDPVDYPDAASVEWELRDWFLTKNDKVRVVQMNSKAVDNAAAAYYDKECAEGDVLWIVCGGNAISRGLTLEGLTVSYYDRVRRGSAVDSITQMGRWFGYRKGYELLPRIWMTEESIGVMKDICRTENQLHEAIRQQSELEELQSIRTGRDVTMVRYFGRRLTSRDANSERLDGANTYGVFNCVLEDCDPALRLTQEFFASLGVENVLKRTGGDGYCDELHDRHRNYWRDIDASRIVAYLERMRRDAFVDASRDGVGGLVRDISNFIGTKWNVVIDSPQGRPASKTLQGIEGVEGVVLRNYQAVKIPGGIRLGHAALPGEAFLSGIQSRYIALGRQVGTDRLSDITVLKRVFDSVAKDRDAASLCEKRADFESAMNPVLAISFVSGTESRTYVLLSFYWHGHHLESYLRAIVNPDAPVSVPIEMIVDAISSVLEREFFLHKDLLKERVCLKLKEKIASPDFCESDFDKALSCAHAVHLVPDDSRLLSETWCSAKWIVEMKGTGECESDSDCICRQLEAEARSLLDEYHCPCLNFNFIETHPNRKGIVNHDNFEELFLDLLKRGRLSQITINSESGWDVQKKWPIPCEFGVEAIAFDGKQYWMIEEPEYEYDDAESHLVGLAVADDARCDAKGVYPCVRIIFAGGNFEHGGVLSVEGSDATYNSGGVEFEGDDE